MAKVSMHLGFTFRVGPLDMNQYGRIDLNVDQIDTELDVTEQLEKVQQTVKIINGLQSEIGILESRKHNINK